MPATLKKQHCPAAHIEPQPEMTTICPAQPWYVAHTRPRQESIALDNLLAQGFNAYLPLYKTYKKQIAGSEPMFPRYIFLQPANPQQSLATVRSTRGITHLIRFGLKIASLDPAVLKAIQALEKKRNETPEDQLARLRPGRRVRVRDTPLDGLEGLVHTVSSKRVTLLMEILGQQRELIISSDNLETLD
ncbi:transcription termination/antitermination protein NusG [Pusillimonas sp. ANT_WB101]|uniref:transcription termination/antitermination protein NusG n=1 Tax=Pusillimonas sp. ANT_WB101 TaxID=2597356 RepID=UPI00210327DC|nr:transcription termination/antitermination NusG family protein [Pusillimonas sp. ANT_WB101]